MACKTKNTTTKKTAKTNKKKTIASSEFSFFAPDAESVYLAGDFNNWDTGKDSMRKFKGNIFKKKLKLKPGSYEYLFYVDGQWQLDPQNPERNGNTYGGENSVITVGEDVVQQQLKTPRGQ